MQKQRTQFMLFGEGAQYEFWRKKQASQILPDWPQKRPFKTALGVLICLPLDKLTRLAELQADIILKTKSYHGKIPLYLIIEGVNDLPGFKDYFGAVLTLPQPLNPTQLTNLHQRLAQKLLAQFETEGPHLANGTALFFPQALAVFYPPLLEFAEHLPAGRVCLQGIYLSTTEGFNQEAQSFIANDVVAFSVARQVDDYAVRHRKAILTGVGLTTAFLLVGCWLIALDHEYKPSAPDAPVAAPAVVAAPPIVATPAPTVAKPVTHLQPSSPSALQDLAPLHCNFPASIKNNDATLRLIHSAFFSKGRQPHLEVIFEPLYLSKNLAEFQVTDQNQSLFYQNGPRLSQAFSWPEGSGTVKTTFTDLNGQALTEVHPGLWGLIDFINTATGVKSINATHVALTFSAGSYSASYDVSLADGDIAGVLALKGLGCH